MRSKFIKKKNVDVFYIIHRNTLTNEHVETLPFVFVTKQQANRYLTNMLDVFIGVEKSKYIDDVKYIYKVQRVSLLEEHKTMTKKEFESLPKQKIVKLITLNPQRKAKVDGYLFDDNLTDDEYFETVLPIYLEQAMEDGIVK